MKSIYYTIIFIMDCDLDTWLMLCHKSRNVEYSNINYTVDYWKDKEEVKKLKKCFNLVKLKIFPPQIDSRDELIMYHKKLNDYLEEQEAVLFGDVD